MEKHSDTCIPHYYIRSDIFSLFKSTNTDRCANSMQKIQINFTMRSFYYNICPPWAPSLSVNSVAGSYQNSYHLIIIETETSTPRKQLKSISKAVRVTIV